MTARDEQPERFERVDPETFLALWEKAVRAVPERPPLTQAEFDAGWREDPGGSSLRRNEITGELDDSCFVHVSTTWHLRKR
jgi:hypothetical protein